MKWLLLLFRPFSANACALDKLCSFPDAGYPVAMSTCILDWNYELQN
jgi:hypothetical protein